MKLQVGVKVVIKNHSGLYLLIQRSQPLSDGTEWDIPGGRIDPSESLEDALMREVLEEVSIRLDGPAKLVRAQDIFVPSADLHVVRLTYITVLEHDITLGDEHKSFRWVTRQDALALNLDPYLREVLENN